MPDSLNASVVLWSGSTEPLKRLETVISSGVEDFHLDRDRGVLLRLLLAARRTCDEQASDRRSTERARRGRDRSRRAWFGV